MKHPAPHQFDANTKYEFRIDHPVDRSADGMETFRVEKKYPDSVWAAMQTISKYDLPWLQLSYQDAWSRRISEEAVWARYSGMVIERSSAVFNDGWHEGRLLKAEPMLRATSWGWLFTDSDNAMDGLAHKHIGFHLKPTIARAFDTVCSLEFHLHSESPVIPDWLDAEYFPSVKALAIYGAASKTDDRGALMRDDDSNIISFPLGRRRIGLSHVETTLSGNVPKDEALQKLAEEMHIAMQIQGTYGIGEANEWVKLHRGLYDDVLYKEDESDDQ